ncbi:MAG: DUF397 domain-containing protein [Pseudonocardiaceae bacterium]
MNKTDLSQAVWRTSSRSSANSQFVEVAFTGDRVSMRDSKNPARPALVVSQGEWTRSSAVLTTTSSSAHKSDPKKPASTTRDGLRHHPACHLSRSLLSQPSCSLNSSRQIGGNS